jgi:hypothetical protein
MRSGRRPVHHPRRQTGQDSVHAPSPLPRPNRNWSTLHDNRAAKPAPSRKGVFTRPRPIADAGAAAAHFSSDGTTATTPIPLDFQSCVASSTTRMVSTESSSTSPEARSSASAPSLSGSNEGPGSGASLLAHEAREALPPIRAVDRNDIQERQSRRSDDSNPTPLG